MSATAVKSVSNISISTADVKANGIEKVVKNISGVDITAFQPIINAGWDVTADCMLVALPSAQTDIIIGITVMPIKNNSVPLAKYVSSGLMLNINTSAWAANDFIYAKTDGSFTNDPIADPGNTIPQEIGLVIRSHATLGEVYISTVGSQIKYAKLAVSEIVGTLLIENTVNDGTKQITIKHDGTDSEIKGFSGLMKMIGTKLRSIVTSDITKYVDIYHDGTNGFIEPSTGAILTNNHVLNTGTAALQGSTAILSNLTSDEVVMVNGGGADKSLVSVAKETAFNKPFGTSASTVSEGNHNHDGIYTSWEPGTTSVIRGSDGHLYTFNGTAWVMVPGS